MYRLRKTARGLMAIGMALGMSCSRPNYQGMNQEEAFLDSLLTTMTIEEKIGQMTQICISNMTVGNDKVLVIDTSKAHALIRDYHVGSFISGTGSKNQWIDFTNILQKYAVEGSRLKIPLLIGIDHVHGANYVDEGTIYPHQLLMACSFDTALVGEMAFSTVQETAEAGLHLNFVPVLGIARNPSWPRFYETFGEDPLTVSLMGQAVVNAHHKKPADDLAYVSSCAKHFIAYSDPSSGWDRTPAEIPMQPLYEYFAPSFKKAIEAGTPMMMLNSGELNGVPVHVSSWAMQDLLREQFGFNGVIISDIKDLLKVVELHQYVATEKEATLMAIQAGLDLNMACDGINFCEIMYELVEEGKVSETRIDESVRKIIKLKMALGLFEKPYTPEHYKNKINKPNMPLATKLAEESIVLLKNDGILPFDKTKIKKVGVVGFAAHSKAYLNGPWTHEWLGAPDDRHHKDMLTLFEALQKHHPEIDFILMDENNPLPNADAYIFTIGEKPYSEFKGNATRLTLDEGHRSLAIKLKKINKPVVAVMISGRPRIITDIEPGLSAILFAGFPGMGGGEALAKIIGGQSNPSGKLAFSFPLDENHHTTYYHKPSDKATHLYPFGHGLSYTSFNYGTIEVVDTLVEMNKPFMVQVKVSNTGQMAGKEVVHCYYRDEQARFTRPVKKLVAFKKISLEPGESKIVRFEFIPEKDFSYPDEKGQMHLEEGALTLMVGKEKKRVWLVDSL